VTLDASNLSCTTAGGSPLSSLSATTYTLDGSSCSGIIPPANYKIKYVGAARASPSTRWRSPSPPPTPP
jgi:hypothetical protein